MAPAHAANDRAAPDSWLTTAMSALSAVPESIRSVVAGAPTLAAAELETPGAEGSHAPVTSDAPPGRPSADPQDESLFSYAFALLAPFPGTDGSIPTALVTEGTFESWLSVHGELDAESSAQIVTPTFDVRPEIAWIVEEGTKIVEGDRLVAFDTAEMERSLEAAEAELDLARTKIAQESSRLQLELANAQSTITKTELDLQMAQMRITDSETVPLVEREQARVAEAKASMANEAAHAELRSVKLKSRAEVQLQQLTVDKSERVVAELREQLDAAVLFAPTSGIAILEPRWDGMKWKVGEKPWAGVPLIKLPELGTMQVEAYVHEIDTPRIEVGQRARVTLDAYPNAPVAGVVSKVADLAVARGEDEVKYLEILVTLAESRPEMKPGMTARVDLLLASVPGASAVPLEAVFRDGEDAWIHVAKRGGWSRHPIETGIENDTHVIVSSGVEPGARIALVDPSAWAEDIPRSAADEITPPTKRQR